jgi:hypothetical protein
MHPKWYIDVGLWNDELCRTGMIDYGQAVVRGALRNSEDHKIFTEPDYTRHNSLDPVVRIMIVHAHRSSDHLVSEAGALRRGLPQSRTDCNRGDVEYL